MPVRPGQEVQEYGVKHAKEVHGFTDEQVNAPKFLEESKKLIKKHSCVVFKARPPGRGHRYKISWPRSSRDSGGN